MWVYTRVLILYGLVDSLQGFLLSEKLGLSSRNGCYNLDEEGAYDDETFMVSRVNHKLHINANHCKAGHL